MCARPALSSHPCSRKHLAAQRRSLAGVPRVGWLAVVGALALMLGACAEDSTGSGGGPQPEVDAGRADTGGGDGDLGAGGDLGRQDLGEGVGDGGGAVDAAGDGGVAEDAAVGPQPPEALVGLCGERDWSETLVPSTDGHLAGEYLGYLEGLGEQPFRPGTVESMKIIASHPLWVQTIRVAFGGGQGTARIRLTAAYGRSYPPTDWAPELRNDVVDLMPPVDLEVLDPSPDEFIEIDVSEQGIFLEPTQHYMLTYQHLGPGPYLALESVPEGERSRALLVAAPSPDAYALGDGERMFNYRLELRGEWFCGWEPEQRLFEALAETPFGEARSEKVALVDLNDDGHDDLVVQAPRVAYPELLPDYREAAPTAYLGDGRGGFEPHAADAFAEVLSAAAFVFGDVDNDGDQDLFVGPSVSLDRDLDGYELESDPPDCDDADPEVHPDAHEVPDGRDNDCDGVVDDGLNEVDQDGDAVSVAEGDCDDTRAEAYPGAPERRNGRDDDCDALIDEDFVNRLLLNDGTGRFVRTQDAGVEHRDPTTVAGFADANGDGQLDLYWGNWLLQYPEDWAAQDHFVRGRGDGTFEEATEGAGMLLEWPLSPYGLAWTDFDGDGWPDLYVGNYHLYPNQLWRNQGDGTFVDVAEERGVAFDGFPAPDSLGLRGLTGGHTYGADSGDIDNDGDLDLFIPNLAHPRAQRWSDRSMLAVNQGPPDFDFVDEVEGWGLPYDEGDVMGAFGDWDNDGDLDLAVASLYPGHYSRLYRNDGPEAGFVDVTYETGTAVHDAVSVVWGDVDEDGWLDLVLGDRSGLPQVQIFRNHLADRPDSAGRHWVALRLVGTRTNRDGLGARVSVTAGGVTRIREVRGGGGLGSTQHSRWVHFGLGAAEAVEAVSVRWVGGEEEAIEALQVDGRYLVEEGSGQAVRVADSR